MIAIWFDPGKLTGVCAVNPETGQVLLLDEYNLRNTGRVLDAEVDDSFLYDDWYHQGPDFRREVYVGWETYTIMGGAQTQAPYALEVIGMLKYLCSKYGYIELTPASPSQRLVANPAMLKTIGWYRPGKKDAISAAQHSLAWFLRTDTLPKQYWDAIYGPLH